VTAWGRHYVQETLKKAEEFGLKPLYADTDSAFLLYQKPENEKKVLEFQKKVNAELPEGSFEFLQQGPFHLGFGIDHGAD
jgi:DNA polymerase I